MTNPSASQKTLLPSASEAAILGYFRMTPKTAVEEEKIVAAAAAVDNIVDYVVAAKFATAKDDLGHCHRSMEGVGIIYSWISFSVELAVDRFRCRRD